MAMEVPKSARRISWICNGRFSFVSGVPRIAQMSPEESQLDTVKRRPAHKLDWRAVLIVLRNKLFAGIVAAIPLIVTFFVLKIAYGFINDISQPVLDRMLWKPIPG